VRIRRSLEEKLGVEEAAYLIEGRPPGGWDALVTKEYLDLRVAALEHKLLAEMERRFRAQTWFMVSAMLTGFGILGAILRIG
jgi:hypothetical protein